MAFARTPSFDTALGTGPVPSVSLHIAARNIARDHDIDTRRHIGIAARNIVHNIDARPTTALRRAP
jgi:hypothetical protein